MEASHINPLLEQTPHQNAGTTQARSYPMVAGLYVEDAKLAGNGLSQSHTVSIVLRSKGQMWLWQVKLKQGLMITGPGPLQVPSGVGGKLSIVQTLPNLPSAPSLLCPSWFMVASFAELIISTPIPPEPSITKSS